jgi:putative acetyltransferase
MEILIRSEQPGDAASISHVNEDAFGQRLEARLVDRLRANGGVLLSLVAVVDGRIAGHILFSPVRVDSDGADCEGAGLGPMAVLPEMQRRGIGSRLIAEGLAALRARGYPFVIVLGHPQFYPRFGFEPASRHGVRAPWRVPDEAFMLLALDPSRVVRMSGPARFRQEFETVR